ncbi:hypothetical protein BDA99DRAFT_494186 [Phascolomyces articulosus]|uniref:Uncharacterized protein n=1 Tax=Phascolomyces articulosus TaxID=60185 RepID=A0AAD5KP34_9FUNG|nr:hypothetical protein BDA99DRAFT_494186 [Phascolomyces articulosus]
MSTVAMTRMTSDIQDDSTMVQTTTTNSTENNNPESLNNNNNKKKNGGTRKSDSGVYFAMMLSEYLEKNANELPSDQLTPISESLSNQQDSTGQESKNGSDSNTASSNNHTADAPASSTTVTALDTTQPPAAFTAYKTRHNTEKEDHDDSAEAAANEAMANLSNLIW